MFKCSSSPSLFPHDQFGYIQIPYLEHSLVDIIPHTHPIVCCLLVHASTELTGCPLNIYLYTHRRKDLKSIHTCIDLPCHSLAFSCALTFYQGTTQLSQTPTSWNPESSLSTGTASRPLTHLQARRQMSIPLT